MFVLHVVIKMKPGCEKDAEQTYSGPFKTAISAQSGFRGVDFLRPGEGGDYVLSIAFESQSLQEKWVATDLHARVWPQMEANFDGYTVKSYTAV